MLKVGLVGVGGISKAHINAWERMEDMELVALCDVQPEKLAPYENKRCYTDYDRMLQAEDLDILDICAPAFLHTGFSLKALEQGIHVVCEKPLSLNPEDARLIYETAEKNGVKFMVAQVVRFDRNYQILKKLYDDQTYGKLLSLSMRRLCQLPGWSHNNWMKQKEKSGLAAFDMHVHDLDFCVYAFGAPKNAIRHRTNAPGQDYVHAVYEYDDFIVSAEAAWFATPYPFNAGFRAQFERAMLECGYGKFTLYEADGTVVDLLEAANGPAIINLPPSNGYYNELRYFADCVRDNLPQDIVKAWEVETVLTLAKAFG